MKILFNHTVKTRYKLRWVIIIAIAWTVIDLFLYYQNVSDGFRLNSPYKENSTLSYITKGIYSFITNAIIGYILLINLGNWMQRRKLFASWLIKALVLLVVVLVVSILFFFIYYRVVVELTFAEAVNEFSHYVFYTTWLADVLLSRFILILLTQVIFEIDQKYSPGVFWDMLTGKYQTPKSEKRILMFMDLVDSTPISEYLGHEKYFSFIRDFVFHVSNAGLENEGRIYQYVGDEVIFTWPSSEENSFKCINTIIEARKNIQKNTDYFRSAYNIVPDFRVGIHAGTVTIGEIGVIKRDIAISGEAMNITARIRSECSKLKQKYIVSEDYFNYTTLNQWQGEDLGLVILKGLENHPIKLYSLKV